MQDLIKPFKSGNDEINSLLHSESDTGSPPRDEALLQRALPSSLSASQSQVRQPPLLQLMESAVRVPNLLSRADTYKQQQEEFARELQDIGTTIDTTSVSQAQSQRERVSRAFIPPPPSFQHQRTASQPASMTPQHSPTSSAISVEGQEGEEEQDSFQDEAEDPQSDSAEYDAGEDPFMLDEQEDFVPSADQYNVPSMPAQVPLRKRTASQPASQSLLPPKRAKRTLSQRQSQSSAQGKQSRTRFVKVRKRSATRPVTSAAGGRARTDSASQPKRKSTSSSSLPKKRKKRSMAVAKSASLIPAGEFTHLLLHQIL